MTTDPINTADDGEDTGLDADPDAFERYKAELDAAEEAGL